MKPDQSIISRIQKLLALGSNNPEEHEAKAAFKKAAELAEQHGFALSDMSTNEDTGETTAETTKEFIHIHDSKYKIWEQPLLSVISKCFDCHPLIVNKNQYCFFGTPTDVKMCIWYFKLIRMKTIRAASMKYRRVKDQKEFGLGVLFAIRERLFDMFLKEQEELRAASTTALVIVKKELVKKAFDTAHPNVKKSQSKYKANGSFAARSEGIVTGKRMGLHRGELTGSQQNSLV